MSADQERIKENVNIEKQIEKMLEKVLKDEDDDCDSQQQTLHTLVTERDDAPSFIFEDNNRRDKKLYTVNPNANVFKQVLIQNERNLRNEITDSPNILRGSIQRYNKKSRTYAYNNGGAEKLFPENNLFQAPLIFDEVSDLCSQMRNSNLNGYNSFQNIR